MKRIFQIILGLIAIAAGLTGAWYGRSTYLESVVTIQFPVPIQDIEPYTLLTPAMLAWRDFPRALIETQGDYATQPEDLTGKITTSRLVAGLPIPTRLVVSPSEFRLADPDLEVLSLPVTPEVAVGGQIQIGDQVNIYRLTAWEEPVVGLFTPSGIASSGSIWNTVPDSMGDSGPSDAGEAFPDSTGDSVPDNAGDAIQTGITLTETVSTAQTQTFTKIELIATVPVVQVLSGDGTREAQSEAEPVPLQILVLAAPPAVVQDILDAQAATTVGNNQLWITLAVPESH
jgi:Flp pilus assembly protein CpaB